MHLIIETFQCFPWLLQQGGGCSSQAPRVIMVRETLYIEGLRPATLSRSGSFCSHWLLLKNISPCAPLYKLPAVLFCDCSRNLSRQDLVDYISSHYKAPRMVLSAAGGRRAHTHTLLAVNSYCLWSDVASIWRVSWTGVNHEELVGLARSHFSGVSFEYDGDAVPVLSPCRFTGSEVR